MSNQSYYGQPPPGQYPPQGQQQWGPPPSQQYGGHSPVPPPQGGYGPPPPPPGQYPPQQPPPHQPYPPQGSPYPPQQAPYGQPFPPPPQGGGYQQYPTPPHQQYGAPAPPPPLAQIAHHGPPDPPSLGYNPSQTAQVDTSRDADALRAAMKGFGTDEGRLISVLAGIPDPLVMANLHHTYNAKHRRNLEADIKSETSGYFEEALLALVRGPLRQDVWNLRDALKGVGTKEVVLNDVLCGRRSADIEAIKNEYQRTYSRPLLPDIQSDLSFKTRHLFTTLLTARRAPESTPIIPQQIELAVSDLHHATAGRTGTDENAVTACLTSHSDGQLRAISQAYGAKYRTPLAKVIASEFSGHMKDAFLRMLAVAEDRAGADAKALEACMAGPGTKDRLLVNRVVRARWDRGHWGQVKGAYRHFHKGRELGDRVAGETSGHYRKLLVRLCEG